MDEFVLNIDLHKFQSTNAAWNDLMLNDPWSVGYVTTIIEYKTFSSKEEWEELYYKTGVYRDNVIDQEHTSYKEILNDESLIRTDKNKVWQLPPAIRALNTAHGRTKKELWKKAGILHEYMKRKGSDINLDECFACIRFRTICETWNGVVIREKNTIRILETKYPNYKFRKVSGEMDHTYAVDYEVLKEGTLILALQIKPESYTWNAPYIIKARSANKKKNTRYFQHFGANVIDVIAKTSGEIVNMDEIQKVF